MLSKLRRSGKLIRNQFSPIKCGFFAARTSTARLEASEISISLPGRYRRVPLSSGWAHQGGRVAYRGESWTGEVDQVGLVRRAGWGMIYLIREFEDIEAELEKFLSPERLNPLLPSEIPPCRRVLCPDSASVRGIFQFRTAAPIPATTYQPLHIIEIVWRLKPLGSPQV